MKPYYSHDQIEIYHGDAMEAAGKVGLTQPDGPNKLYFSLHAVSDHLWICQWECGADMRHEGLGTTPALAVCRAVIAAKESKA